MRSATRPARRGLRTGKRSTSAYWRTRVRGSETRAFREHGGRDAPSAPEQAPGLLAPLTAARTDRPDGLTPRELEVVGLVAEGLTDAQVAERLFVSLRTVNAHLRSIYRKLDVRSRSAATRYAVEQGLVTILPSGAPTKK